LLLLSIIIKPNNLPLDGGDEYRFTADLGGLDLNVNPGPAELAVHRKIR